MNTNKTTNDILASTPWLGIWQKRLIIIAGALACAAAVMLIVKWLESRRLARLAAAEQADSDKS